MVAIRKTTRGVDIKNVIHEALTRFRVPLNRLVSVATDGAPSMAGKRVGLIGLTKSDSNLPKFFQYIASSIVNILQQNTFGIKMS